MIQMNAGTDSVKSSRSMSLIGDIMNKPTNTRIGQVAALGMERKSGAKSKAIPKQIAVTKEVIPERRADALYFLLYSPLLFLCYIIVY